MEADGVVPALDQADDGRAGCRLHGAPARFEPLAFKRGQEVPAHPGRRGTRVRATPHGRASGPAAVLQPGPVLQARDALAPVLLPIRPQFRPHARRGACPREPAWMVLTRLSRAGASRSVALGPSPFSSPPPCCRSACVPRFRIAWAVRLNARAGSAGSRPVRTPSTPCRRNSSRRGRCVLATLLALWCCRPTRRRVESAAGFLIAVSVASLVAGFHGWRITAKRSRPVFAAASQQDWHFAGKAACSWIHILRTAAGRESIACDASRQPPLLAKSHLRIDSTISARAFCVPWWPSLTGPCRRCSLKPPSTPRKSWSAGISGFPRSTCGMSATFSRRQARSRNKTRVASCTPSILMAAALSTKSRRWSGRCVRLRPGSPGASGTKLSRAALPVIERVDGRARVNPLAYWDAAMIDTEFVRRALPRHSFTVRGFAPCTWSVQPGAAPRSRHWAVTGKTECGIHRPTGKQR